MNQNGGQAMTHQFALKQDVRTPDGDGFVEFIGNEWISVAIGAESYSFRPSQLTPLEPARGQEIEVALEYGPWERRIFLALYDDRVWVTNDGRGWYPRWRFIPEPEPSAFTPEQLAELDARYARREDA